MWEAKLLVYVTVLSFMLADQEINATKLVSARRTGIDKLTFVCKFSMKRRKKVTWHLNNFTIEGYPHFKVTNKYKKKQKILVSTLKIVRPEITWHHDNYTCKSDGASHKFTDVEGILWVDDDGTGRYYFSSYLHKYKFNAKKVKRICKKWKATFVYLGSDEKDSCIGYGCRCDLKAFGVKDTLSKRSKIKPTPYVRLKLTDRINLPKNFNVTIDIWDGNTSESTCLITIKGIRRKKVKIFSRKLRPETKYYVTINAFDPIVPKKGAYSYVDRQPVYSSSLTPGTASISSASLEGDKCRIKTKFPTNVDVKDTYTHFKPQILVNGKIADNISRVSDDVFEVNVDDNKENIVSARIMSTKKRYNSKLSNPLKCLKTN